MKNSEVLLSGLNLCGESFLKMQNFNWASFCVRSFYEA